MLLQHVTLDDIRPIAVGAGILGTGGGGNPYLGSLHLRQVIAEHGPQTILDPMTLDDDALIVEVGGIGAPTAGIEKIPEGTEMVRALRLLEKHLNRQFDAVIIAEIGGANAMQPLIGGLLAGIPNVDGDSMGRAFPELQMSSFLFGSDAHVAPFAMVDAGVNAIVVPHTVSDVWSERIARNIAISFGARAALAGTVMTGAQVKASCIPYTLTLAHRLGNRVFAAQDAHEDVPEAIADLLQGKVIFRGKILDVDRRTTKGFARGSVTIQSFGAGDPLRIEFQNEFLVAYQGDTPLVTVPDSICIVAEDSGEPVTTELLRYGMRVAVLGVPAAAALKTPTALGVVGPKAFGYDIEFKPLPGNCIGVLPVE